MENISDELTTVLHSLQAELASSQKQIWDPRSQLTVCICQRILAA